jgi:hypothetical protein
MLPVLLICGLPPSSRSSHDLLIFKSSDFYLMAAVDVRVGSAMRRLGNSGWDG